MSKIVVFGAGGFIGQHLVRRFAKEPDHSVVAFGRFADYQRGAASPFAEYANVQLVSGDFFNQRDLDNAIDGADYVFHLVTTTTPATSNDDPFIDIETNVRGSIELFELCTKHQVKKVIFLSSGGSVYGAIDSTAINERTLPEPRSPYGIGKLTVEHFLRYFKFTKNLDYVVYRVANPYGPGQNIYGRQGVIPIFMHKFLSNQPITVYGTGNMVRDYIYIDDLIDMLAGTYAKPNKHSEYNLGSGHGVSVNELISAIETCAGHSVEKEYMPTPATFLEKNVLDINRFVEEFGIKPATSLEDGMQRTWDYVKKFS
ncbi:MAG TPA: NAD-dependent epimerase/dehydratase family protein [Candidatus Saccharimonadales bacterium]|nr:NAD-dependent epimerase/dehydratase family protein [Candidatus Saccharimonadales bacterium]